jgi:hypothetical protein
LLGEQHAAQKKKHHAKKHHKHRHHGHKPTGFLKEKELV